MTHTLYHGDAIEVLKGLADNSIDSIVTDPPSSINFMGLEWDNDKGGRDKWIAWLSSIMKECLRVLKPGGHAAVWSLPRTSHWTGMALETAGFEVRDCISHLYDSGRDVTAFLETLSPEQRTMLEIILANNDDTFTSFLHCFGSGFPKSLDISKAIDQHLGMEREVVGKVNGGAKNGNGNNNDYGNYNSAISGEYNITAPASPEAKQHNGWGSALKPAFEQWWLVRKPLSEPTIAENMLKWGTGGINVDACRVATGDGENFSRPVNHNGLHEGWDRPWRHDDNALARERIKRDEMELKAQQLGRFPSHLIHDGSEAVEAEFAKAGVRSSGGGDKRGLNNGSIWGNVDNRLMPTGHECNSGSASRFFYCAKPSPRERNEGLDGFEEKCVYGDNGDTYKGLSNTVNPSRNTHPTVKSLNLMSYLCKMITPKGGTVLDCFMGSGTTGMSAIKEGFNFIGIEKERNYFEIAEARIRHANLGQQGTIIAPEPLPVKPKVKLQMEMF